MSHGKGLFSHIDFAPLACLIAVVAGRVWRRSPPHALAVDALHLAGAAAAAVVTVTAHGPAARGAGGDEWLVAGLEGGQRRVVLGVLAARVRRGRRTAAGGTSRTVGGGGGEGRSTIIKFS